MAEAWAGPRTVDYILFIRAPVTIAANPNEVMDFKYVGQDELRTLLAAADAPDAPLRVTPWFRLIAQTHLFSWWDTLAAGRDLPCDATTIHRML